MYLFIFVIRSLVATCSISLSIEFSVISVESYLINSFKSTSLSGNRKWRNTINRISRHYLTKTKLRGINVEKGRHERNTRTHARRPPLFQAVSLWGQAINEGEPEKRSCQPLFWLLAGISLVLIFRLSVETVLYQVGYSHDFSVLRLYVQTKHDTISGVELLTYIPYFMTAAPKDT